MISPRSTSLALRPVPRSEEPFLSSAERVKKSQEEGKAAAIEHAAELASALTLARELAKQIASGGETYPAGLRHDCLKLEQDLGAELLRVEGINWK